MINILTEDFLAYMDDTLQYIRDNEQWFSSLEYEKFKRVVDYMRANPVDNKIIRDGRRDFYVFFTENDRRLGTNLLQVFPEYTEFYKLCENVYNTYDK